MVRALPSLISVALAAAQDAAPSEIWETSIASDGSARGILQRRAVLATNATVGDECSAYMASTGCGWTLDYNCPGQTGGKGQASADGSTGYHCCCEQGGWHGVSGECPGYLASNDCAWTRDYNCPGQEAGSKGPATNDGSVGYWCCCAEGGWHQLDGPVTVTLDPSTKHQSMLGYGSAISQASAHVLKSLKGRNARLYDQVMRKLFGTGQGDAGISLLRFPVGSCDYSLVEATWDDAADDYDLQHFTPDADSEKIIEILLDAKAINPDILLMATPWTAPAWLKQTKSLSGGGESNTLLDEELAYQTYARYLAGVVETMAERGLPLAYMSLQNEPLFGDGEYPGMYLSASDAARLGQTLAPYLQVSGPKLLAYDHNWDHPEYPEAAIAAAPGIFAGTAWHCYAGDMANAQDRLHRSHPEHEQLFTECTGSYPDNNCDISRGMEGFGWNHQWDMENIFLGNAAHWGQGGLKWLTVLDEHCGPQLPQVSFRWGRPLLSIPSGAGSIEDVVFNQGFFTLAHMGRFVRPGARRIGTKISGISDAIIEAFEDTSVGTVTLIAVNKDHSRKMDLTVNRDGATFSYSVPAWGTVILVWKAPVPPSPQPPSPQPPSPQPPSPQPPSPPSPSDCPGGSLSACLKLCPTSSSTVYELCVQTCLDRCASGGAVVRLV